ncbi:MAG: glycoside hydrolase family 57 protein [Bacteroidia bacterium]|nr:glycoside hydrolase family 57 protein [Bacteroidia bacterium]
MAQICLYFQAHQPHRLRPINPFDIGKGKDPFDHFLNADILHRVADKCYLPTNQLLLKLIKATQGRFRLAFSLSGCLLDQLEESRKDVIESFQELAACGCVEFLAETYQHSLASIMDWEEFDEQVEAHSQAIFRLFGQWPKVFRNTELIYSNELAKRLVRQNYKGIVTEGIESMLPANELHSIYQSATLTPISVILRDYERSDDLAFRFNDENWEYYPLETAQFQKWIEGEGRKGSHIFLDYETFGEHQDASNGVFDFFHEWVLGFCEKNEFFTPNELISSEKPTGIFDSPSWISWADTERDLSAWQGNDMQKEALSKVFLLKPRLENNSEYKQTWKRLLQSDHFYYMATKEGADGEVHEYFSPFATPHDAYLRFMNIIADLDQQL